MGEKLEPGVSVHVSNETSKQLQRTRNEVLKKKKSRELMTNQGYWNILDGEWLATS